MKNLIIICLVILISGCAPKTRYIDKTNDDGKAVLSLDYRDFDETIREMMESLILSGALRNRDGRRYVMTTGEIVNDTTQRIDTRQLMATIEEELLNSNQVDITSAIGDASDSMINESRVLRQSEEFDQSTVKAKGKLISPDLSFSGKIFERIVPYDRRTKQVEYYIELKVTNLETGLRHWQKQTQILKRGSKKAPIW